jgi:hypothetical protein
MLQTHFDAAPMLLLLLPLDRRWSGCGAAQSPVRASCYAQKRLHEGGRMAAALPPLGQPGRVPRRGCLVLWTFALPQPPNLEARNSLGTGKRPFTLPSLAMVCIIHQGLQGTRLDSEYPRI